MIAIVTGASSGIGLSISKELIKHNYKVIGLASSFENKTFYNSQFQKIKCDLSNIKQTETVSKNILKHYNINILINCAGFGEFKPHEEIAIDTINKMIDINLKAPIILTKLFLRSLKNQAKLDNKAHIINISSIEATRHSKFSALYTATKSGLKDFSLSLFEELRKTKVRTTVLNLDMTKTNFFNNLQFECSKDRESFIDTQTVSETIIDIINSKSVITQLTLRPQKLNIAKKTSAKI